MIRIVILAFIMTPMSLYSQHYIALNIGYGNKIKFNDHKADVITSANSFSLGASCFFQKNINGINFEAGLDFTIFGYAYSFPNKDRFGAPYTSQNSEFGYSIISTITNVVLSFNNLHKFKLALGPGVNYGLKIDGDTKFYNFDAATGPPPVSNDLYLNFLLDNDDTRLSFSLRLAIIYSASRKLQMRLGIERFITPIAHGNYQFYNDRDDFGKIKVRPTYIKLSVAHNF